MDAYIAQQPATSTGDNLGRSGRDERRCVLFGCLEAAAWIISDLYGGELAVCEVNLHVLLSDALARTPPDSSIRVEGWRPEPPALHDRE
jgi:hypothetical protein